jgi:HEAT repeat protein
MRFEAARAVGELEYGAAVPHLIELLDDPDREVQMVAVSALGQIGGRSAKDALTQLTESDDEVLRDLADEALQELQISSDPNLLLFDLDLDAEADELDALDELDELEEESDE